MSEKKRSQWSSRAGFILAAAGSAVGLGNLWKFPYITGENGGGAFVLVYLVCIAAIGLPIMVGEVVLGQMTQKSPVGAIESLTSRKSVWKSVGFLGVAAGFVILSYYSVVAGWAMHYVWLAATGTFMNLGPDQLESVGGHFGDLYADPMLNVLWHTLFMGVTIGVVIAGIQKGVEVAARVLMPALFGMLALLVLYGMSMPGFDQAFDFVFGLHTDQLTGGGVLEALGHSFFTLSLGMGAMLTYGSYMKRDSDVVSASITISILDTLVALMACLALFPITFTFGMDAANGPGLVFINMPTAFAQMPGGSYWALGFFVLLTFAALTSAVSLLEVVASYFIDQLKWTRVKAVATTGAVIFLFGVPSALSGGPAELPEDATLIDQIQHVFGPGFQSFTASMFGGDGMNWFDSMDYLASNWMLPLGGLGISVFVGWRLDNLERYHAVADGSPLGGALPLYQGWLQIMRFAVPVAIVLVILHAVGVI